MLYNITLNNAQVLDIKKYVIQKYPNEAIIAVLENNALEYIENVSTQPTKSFEVGKYIKGLRGLIHSHTISGAVCYTGASPSALDIDIQLQMRIPWGVIETNGTTAGKISWFGNLDQLQKPLLGRAFTHGIDDCYSAIRSFYWKTPASILFDIKDYGLTLHDTTINKKNVLLPDFARENLWWENGQDLYSLNFQKAGFKKINADKLDFADIILYKINSNVPNHGAIYLGQDAIYHHLYNRVSEIARCSRWKNYQTQVLRYDA